MAAGDPQDSVTLIRLQVVDADTNKTLQQIRLVKSELASVGTATAAGATGAATSVTSIGNAAVTTQSRLAQLGDASKASIGKATNEVDKLRESLLKTDAAASSVQANVANATTSGGLTGAGLARAGSELRKLPSIQIAGGVGTDSVANILRVVGAIAEVTGGFGALLAVAAPVAVVVGVLTAATNAQKEAQERLAKATQDTIDKLQLEADVREQTAGVIATGSVGTAQAKLTEAETQRDALLTGQYKETVDAMQQYVDEKLRPQAASEAKGDLRAAGINPGDDIYASELARRTNVNLASLTQGDATLKTYSDTLGTFNGQLDKFGEIIKQISETGLPGAKVLEAINQPLEDQQKLRELEAKSSAALIKQRTGDIEELVGVNKRVTDTEAEIAKARADGNNVLADALTNQNVKNRTQATEAERELNLIAIAMKIVYIREEEAAAAEKFGNILKGVIKGVGDVVGNVFKANAAQVKAQDELEKADQQHNEKLDEIYANRADAEDKAYRSRQESLDDLSKKSNDDQLEAEENFQKAKAKIDRDFNKSGNEALQARDAVAYDRAKTQRADDLKDATEAYNKQKKSIQKTLDDQTKIIQRRYNDQLADAQTTLNKAIGLENKRYQYQYDSLKAQVTVTSQAFDAMGTATNRFASVVEAAANRVNVAANSVVTGAGAGVIGGTVGDVFKNLPSHALGLAFVPYDGYVARLHRGERILTERQNRGGRSGGDINIYGIGRTKKQIMHMVEEKLDIVYGLAAH